TRLAEEGESRRAGDELRALVDRHVAVAAAVTTERRAAVTAEVRCEFDELIGLVHALAVLREVSPRSLDAVLAAGELVSSRIVAAGLADHNTPAGWVDARAVLVTDAEYTGAAPDMEATGRRVKERILPVVNAGQVVVIGGFVGATSNGLTTTLGRGGSDYSAAIFGAALGASEI